MPKKFAELKKCCTFAHAKRQRPDGGIGRRAGLKHQWSNPSRFDPGSGYKERLTAHRASVVFFVVHPEFNGRIIYGSYNERIILIRVMSV